MVLREGRATDEWNGVRRGYGGSVGESELREDEAEAVREERQEHESVGSPEEPVTGRDHYQQLQTPAWPSLGLHCGLVPADTSRFLSLHVLLGHEHRGVTAPSPEAKPC